ncbi:hypothetical protein FI667_g10046, partial [Globisporangium splendens]
MVTPSPPPKPSRTPRAHASPSTATHSPNGNRAKRSRAPSYGPGATRPRKRCKQMEEAPAFPVDAMDARAVIGVVSESAAAAIRVGVSAAAANEGLVPTIASFFGAWVVVANARVSIACRWRRKAVEMLTAKEHDGATKKRSEGDSGDDVDGDDAEDASNKESDGNAEGVLGDDANGGTDVASEQPLTALQQFARDVLAEDGEEDSSAAWLAVDSGADCATSPTTIAEARLDGHEFRKI